MQRDGLCVFPPSPVGVATVEGRRLWEQSLPGLWSTYYGAVREFCNGGFRVEGARGSCTLVGRGCDSHDGVEAKSGCRCGGEVYGWKGRFDRVSQNACSDGGFVVDAVESCSQDVRADERGQDGVFAGGSFGSGSGSGSVGCGLAGVSSGVVGARVVTEERSDEEAFHKSFQEDTIAEVQKTDCVGDDVVGGTQGQLGVFSVGCVKKNKPGKKMRERLARKASRSVVGQERGVEEVKSEARVTLEKKWVLQNELAMVKLGKDLEFQRRRDVDAEVRCDRARVLKRTEQDKVAVEKAFSTLKTTGNVAGFCETVVSGAGSSETISPHSSVSEKDVWELNKRVEDLELENAQLRRQCKLGRVELGETVAFTLDEHGAVPESLMDKFEGFNDRDHELVVDIDGGLFDKREEFRPNTVVLKKKVIPCAGDFDW